MYPPVTPRSPAAAETARPSRVAGVPRQRRRQAQHLAGERAQGCTSGGCRPCPVDGPGHGAGNGIVTLSRDGFWVGVVGKEDHAQVSLQADVAQFGL